MKLKIKDLFAVAFAGALVIIAQTTTAQTWQTVDSFQYAPGYLRPPRKSPATPAGSSLPPVASRKAWLGSPSTTRPLRGAVQKSADGGSTWAYPITCSPPFPPVVGESPPTPSATFTPSAGRAGARSASSARALTAANTWQHIDNFGTAGYSYSPKAFRPIPPATSMSLE